MRPGRNTETRDQLQRARFAFTFPDSAALRPQRGRYRLWKRSEIRRDQQLGVAGEARRRCSRPLVTGWTRSLFLFEFADFEIHRLEGAIVLVEQLVATIQVKFR